MGLFNFNKKKEEEPNKPSREESMKKFSNFIKDAMKTDEKGSFFVLMDNNGFYGKALMGDISQFENLFGQLFSEHPEIVDLMQDMINKHKSGTIKFKTNTTSQPVDPELKDLAEVKIGKGNLNQTPGGALSNKSTSPKYPVTPTPLGESDEQKIMKDLLSMAMGKKPDDQHDPKDPLYPRHKMIEEHDKHMKKFNQKGLVDYDINEIRKRLNKD